LLWLFGTVSIIICVGEIYNRRESQSKWKALNGTVVDYLPWSKGEPNGHDLGDECIILKPDPSLYFDIRCKNTYCFNCQFEGETIFKLKGLCLEQELIDTDYIFMHSFIPFGEFTFRGLLGRTNITLNKTTQHWEILSHTFVEHTGHVLGLYNGSKIFPLGVRPWTMTVDCTIKKTRKEMKLKLSKVIIKQLCLLPF
jgi:hypothetical protein